MTTASDVRKGNRVAFRKVDVCEIGTQPDGSLWSGTVARVERRDAARWGGPVVLITLDGLTMSDRPGRAYDGREVVLRADDTVVDLSAADGGRPQYETLEDWTARGREAFADGLARVPAADPTVQTAIAQLTVGQGAAAIMRAWGQGWDAANLADG